MTDRPVRPVGRQPREVETRLQRPPLEPPIAVMVSPADRAAIDAARERSYRLALARRHINR